MVGVIILFIVVYLLFCIVPAYMADKRGRNIIGWFILSIIITPIYTSLILACLGVTEQRYKDRIFQEEKWRILCRKLNTDKEDYEN